MILNLETEQESGGKHVNLRQRGVYYKWCSLSYIWVAYFWRGKEQVTKLDSMILFVTENKMFLFTGL